MASLQKHTEHVWTIDRFLSPLECKALIRFAGNIGYSRSGKGNYEVLIRKDTPLADRFYGRALKHVLPSRGIRLVHTLNPVFRYYRLDGEGLPGFAEDRDHLKQEVLKSCFSFWICLEGNGVVRMEGKELPIEPGTAVMTDLETETDGQGTGKGIKCLIRTDILYKMYEV
jgi:hypothetical protein